MIYLCVIISFSENRGWDSKKASEGERKGYSIKMYGRGYMQLNNRFRGKFFSSKPRKDIKQPQVRQNLVLEDNTRALLHVQVPDDAEEVQEKSGHKNDTGGILVSLTESISQIDHFLTETHSAGSAKTVKSLWLTVLNVRATCARVARGVTSGTR